MLPPAEEIPLAEDTYVPVNMPPMAWHFPSDVHGFNISFNGTCNATISRLYRRAYYAAVAYQDYNIGKVLAALEELGFYNTTVVSVNGDHVSPRQGQHKAQWRQKGGVVAAKLPQGDSCWKP